MVSETAASVGARQIVITDSQISPLATFSDLCFVVKEAQVDAFGPSQQRCAWCSRWWWRWRIGWVKGK
jgi:DNA-binding MurR/RpiR family transcriptional regulator